jgi:diketogulonate reductase-like aldo/keto reductase
VLGLGTWRIAENARRRDDELRALQLGLDLGMTLIDTAEMYGNGSAEELVGEAAATNQVLYNLSRRAIEWDVLPWSQDRGVPITAYSPIEQGRLLAHPSLRAVAARHGATPAQVAIAWVLRQDGVVTVPKAGTPEHVRENDRALELKLRNEDLDELDAALPPADRTAGTRDALIAANPRSRVREIAATTMMPSSATPATTSSSSAGSASHGSGPMGRPAVRDSAHKTSRPALRATPATCRSRLGRWRTATAHPA